MPSSKSASKAASKNVAATKATAKKASAQKVTAEAVDNSAEADAVTLDRRAPVTERRAGDPEASDVGLMKTPRRKKQRRRHIDPTTCERDYNNEEIEFMRAMDDYKRDSGRMFPTCSEILEVVRKIGYIRLNEEQAELLQLGNTVEECEEMMEDYQADELEEAIEA